MDISANIGYFFQRGYYEGLTANLYPIEDKKAAQKTYFDRQNKVLKDSSKVNVSDSEQIPCEGFCEIPLTTIYPGLITGIGMIHATGMQGETKLGMAFDYTSGLPYIPGSSVKGMLRSMFKDSQYIKEIYHNIQNEIWKTHPKEEFPEFGDSEFCELEDLIFEGKKKDKSFLPIYERDVFFDAKIKGDYTEKGILDFDYITHHPNPLKDPEPNMFLKILPNVTFVFAFKLIDSELSSKKIFKAYYKKAIFEAILTTVGIGAKTNVGYGQLKTVNDKD